MQSQALAKNPVASYFANKAAALLVQDVDTRELAQWNMLNSRGLPTLWRLAYAQAFGMDPNTAGNTTQRLQFCGPDMNYVRFRVQLTRPLIKQRNTLAAGQRVAFQALAMNNDSKSLGQVPIAGKVVDYIFREAEGERACFEALESDGYFGEGFVWARWDIDGGDMVPYERQVPATDQFTGQPLTEPDGQTPVMVTDKGEEKSGAPTLTSLYPWDVVREPFARKSPWIMVKEKVSKYELMALWPEHAEALKGKSINFSADPSATMLFNWDISSVTDDMVIVKHFYHEGCKAVPDGRYVGYVDDLVLWDRPCPVTSKMPVVSVCSARYFGTSMGYPEASDLLSIQDMIDELLSQTATGVLKFGNQNLWAVEGLDFDQEAFAKGGAFFTMKPDQEPPQAVQYAQMPDVTKYLLEYLPQRMNEVIGSNDTMRGQPQANITSGAFAALMQSIAEKFISSTQASYDFAVNSVGNMMLELVRSNADGSFAAEVSGASNAPYMQMFTRDDLKGIKRVMIQRQSPLMNSIPGRMDVFTATKDLPKDQRYAAFQLLNTGDSSAWTEDDMSAVVLIKFENEQLSSGKPAPVSKTDDHFIHARQHNGQLNKLRTQEAPTDPRDFAEWEAAIGAYIQHLNEHAQTWVTTDPIFARVLGLPAPPQFDPMSGSFVGGGPDPSHTAAQPASPQQKPPAPAPHGAGLPQQPKPAQPASLQ